MRKAGVPSQPGRLRADPKRAHFRTENDRTAGAAANPRRTARFRRDAKSSRETANRKPTGSEKLPRNEVAPQSHPSYGKKSENDRNGETFKPEESTTYRHIDQLLASDQPLLCNAHCATMATVLEFTPPTLITTGIELAPGALAGTSASTWYKPASPGARPE